MRKPGRQKLLGSLRGSGVLKAARLSAPVRYELDRFEDNQGQRAAGSVSGDLSSLSGEEATRATLVLEDGAELPVLVSNAAEDGADVEVE